jgi:SAM-dependent methyltransferase
LRANHQRSASVTSDEERGAVTKNKKKREDPVAANRRLWDARTPIHVASDFYDVDGFRAGATSLRPLEVEEVGDVAGKRLLHLQCHFGLDTLSWARLGADVTGLDLSGEAVAAARTLAADLDLGGRARFVESDIYDAATALEGETFDVVFTSYGVLAWLPDIERWAEVVASLVAPGGFFYVAEIHPASQVLDDEPGVEELRIGYPYWTPPSGPLRFEESGTYADYEADIKLPEFVWLHGLGDIITALIDAGLAIEFLHEHDHTVFQQLPFLERTHDGCWRLPTSMAAFPLLFSLRASKPKPA